MSLSHIWDESVEDDLLQSTEMFWLDLIHDHDLAYMLTPDCRIASGFHQGAIGVNGIDNCLDLLGRLQKSLNQTSLSSQMQNLMLMKTGTQTRFYIDGIHSNDPFTLSFALEWCNGIIVGIVIVKSHAPEEDFLRDSLDYSFTANATLGRRESLCADYSKDYFFMGGTLDPPYHLPLPPCKLASVIVTVLNCKNLKSRLKRVIERKINSQVVLYFNGRELKTNVIKDSPNPVFSKGGESGESHENPFVFEVPENLDERDPDACIKIFVEDIHDFDINDRLAAVKIPLAAIKCVVSTENPSKMTIPLEMRRRHFGIRETVGILPKDDNIKVSRPGDIYLHKCDQEEASMTILISKIDDLKIWLLKELKMRDQAWKDSVLSERLKKHDQSVESVENVVKLNGGSSSQRNHASDEMKYSQLYPYFLWSLPKERYDTVKTTTDIDST